MLEAQQQAEKLLTKEYLQTQDAQVAMNKEAIERRQMLVSSYLMLMCNYKSYGQERHVKNKNQRTRQFELKAEVDKLERFKLSMCHV